MTTLTELIWSFGNFHLIPSRELLLEGQTPVKLGGRDFQILKLLVEHSGEIVSKEALINAAWPETSATSGNLKVAIVALRKALGDTTTEPTFIATVASRGYRFVAPTKLISDIVSRTFVPVPTSGEIVGRTDELEVIANGLRGHSVVTIAGMGGIGKTKLAVAAASCVTQQFSDGVCWVDLSTVSDPSAVPVALAAALGLRGSPSDSLAAIAEYLRPRQILVLLDNCEHVLSSVTLFVSRLHRDDACRVLATSREPLGSSDEKVLWLKPLSCPPCTGVINANSAAMYSAVALFIERANEQAGFVLTDENSPFVAAICRSLEGLPLAIELAASEIPHQNPEQILDQIDSSTRGWQTSDASGHRALASMIDWSYQLLTRDEATIFCILSVFAGIFESEDVLSVARCVGLDAATVVRGIGSLVSKSLVTVVDGQHIRYRLLEATRRYAEKKMSEESLFACVNESYANRMIDLFGASESDWNWRERGDWSARYRDRLSDLRKAIAWAFSDDGRNDLAVQLSVVAIPVMFEISALTEARSLAERALSLNSAANPQKLKLKSFRAWCMLYGKKLDESVEEAWLDALEQASSDNNSDYELRALLGYTLFLISIGRVSEAEHPLAEFSAIAGSNPHLPIGIDGQRIIALVAAYKGHLRDAEKKLDSLALETPRPTFKSSVAGFHVDRYIGTRNYQSIVAWIRGRPRRAVDIADEAVSAAVALGHSISISSVLVLSALPISLWNGSLCDLTRYTDQLMATFGSEPLELWLPSLHYYRAALSALRSQDGAIDALRQAIEELIEARYTLRIGTCFAFYAQLLAEKGRLSEANEAVTMAFEFCNRQEEWWCQPELQRVKAVVCQAEGDFANAEKILKQSLKHSRATGAKAFELRSANTLAEMYKGRGQEADAYDLVQSIYGRVADGFINTDLTVAERILEKTRPFRAK